MLKKKELNKIMHTAGNLLNHVQEKRQLRERGYEGSYRYACYGEL
jgi:hypothetical protein